MPTGTYSPSNRRKKFKKSTFGYLYQSKDRVIGPKKILKTFSLHLVPGINFNKNLNN
jgi:hypothetical protein